ncbi:OmpA family protein [Nonomuraea sp. NEAU-A123]|uniref:OmpA family protein n=1 Tax=Nonomuraea sp. NEAU-A123 TaxID=2839649 RepID=UPI001BE4D2A8|nr:OmpA family protein [Nonomuraea sp. NEAU-A123]MBT2224992.1 OmpA family protein [Nonomuraea sp. NEAU-A123]
MMLRTLSVLPMLAAVAVTGPAADVPEANIQRAILDLKFTIVPLETEVDEGTRTKITISSDVLFAFDQARLTPVAARHLARIADRLRTASGTVRVDGYTDAVGTTGYNLTLSQRRAQSVKRELDRILHGKPPTTATGHGEADPVAPNVKDGKDNPAGRAKNRRVTIVF